MYFKKRLIFLILILWCSSLIADESGIVLLTPSGKSHISINELRNMASSELEVYDPFQRKTLRVRGIDLITFIERYAIEHSQAKSLKFTAIDDYETDISNWNSGNWLLVTHENGDNLSLRSHGPIKLIEKRLGNRDPENLRNFNDWVWMVKSIEVME